MLSRLKRDVAGLATFGGHVVLTLIAYQIDTPFAWRACLAAVAALSLLGWSLAWRRQRVIADTPTSRIASAAQGYIELHGRAQALEGIPGAMNAPVMGALFRSRDFVNNETELVIIATPYLVRPTSPDRVRTPADGFLNPSEGESLLTGRLNSLYRPASGSRSANDQAGLQGPHGHVIE